MSETANRDENGRQRRGWEVVEVAMKQIAKHSTEGEN